MPVRPSTNWNKLSPDVKSSETVFSFNIKLEAFEKDMIFKRFINYCITL